MTAAPHLLLAAVGLLSVSGVPAFFMGRRPGSRAGQYVSAAILLAGSATGLAAVATALASPGAGDSLRAAWFLPLGEFFIRIDALSAVFLIPVFVLPFLGALFGLGYWPYSDPSSGGRRLGLFYGLLAGGMAMVCAAGDGVLFLIAWELMAVAAYFAATSDGKNMRARKAGWIYLVATHAGTLLLFAMFALWREATGSFALVPAFFADPKLAGAVFVLAALGFGFKAGIVPLHFWLPDFYANAPSHLSGVLSGVMSKMGIYGLIRMSGLLPSPETWWGVTLVAAGSLTALAGILFALGQSNIKRLLAYSSVENVGIITIGIGTALLGRVAGHNEWIALGLCGALFHVWNHGLFKSLLFFNAGTIELAAGTANANLLGGLGKKMPLAMLLFLAGALAISGLPPLNGFASEWLVYGGLFRIMGDDSALAVAGGAAALLAMSGALATAAFVKLFAVVFLGAPRTDKSVMPEKLKPVMAATMAILAAACAALGIFAWKLAPFLQAAAQAWTSSAIAADSTPPVSLEALAPLRSLGAMALVLGALVAAAVLLLGTVSRAKSRASAPTWDCGYAKPTSRMQYTGSSIASGIILLFPIVSPLRRSRPKIEGEFPDKSAFKADLPDTVMDKVVIPAKAAVARAASRFRELRQGNLSRYLLYIFIITILLLAFGSMGVS